MIWLVWRQHRKQALFALLGLVALAAFMVPSGLRMHDAFARAGLDDCLPAAARVEFVQVNPGPDQPPDPVRACQELAGQFANRFGSWAWWGSCYGSCRCSRGCSGGRRWWRARSSMAPTGWSGPRGPAGGAGLWSSSAWSAGAWWWRPLAMRCW